MTEQSMVEFIKMIKQTSLLTDEEASRIAATKAHEALPKSRMYYKIRAQREMGGGKKVDPASNMPAKLRVGTGALWHCNTIYCCAECVECCQHRSED